MVQITVINTDEDLYVHCCKKEHDINAKQGVGVTPEEEGLLDIIKNLKVIFGEKERLKLEMAELLKESSELETKNNAVNLSSI